MKASQKDLSPSLLDTKCCDILSHGRFPFGFLATGMQCILWWWTGCTIFHSQNSTASRSILNGEMVSNNMQLTQSNEVNVYVILSGGVELVLSRLNVQQSRIYWRVRMRITCWIYVCACRMKLSSNEVPRCPNSTSFDGADCSCSRTKDRTHLLVVFQVHYELAVTSSYP